MSTHVSAHDAANRETVVSAFLCSNGTAYAAANGFAFGATFCETHGAALVAAHRATNKATQ